MGVLIDASVLIDHEHARLWAELAAAGQLIGAHDLWLAATCLAGGFSLATGDARDFHRVPGLDVEVWSAT